MDPVTLDKLEFGRIRQIVAGHCSCALGKGLAMRIAPSPSLEKVTVWLEETSQMVTALRDAGPPPFAGVTDISPALGRATPGGGASGEDFAVIAAALSGSDAVRRWCELLDETGALLKAHGAKLPEFVADVAAIRSVVDSRGEVLDSASPTLARIRTEIAATRQRVRDVIYNYARRPEVMRILQNPAVTVHEDRFVLPVKTERRGELPGVVHRASNTGATLFVEPAESVELNNRLVELCDAERREVLRLLDELAIRVHRRLEVIVAALHVLAELDLITAKAKYSFRFELTCPAVSDRGGLNLHQARHPLLIEQAFQQEQAGTPAAWAVVPIDVRLGSDFDVLIITGSNTGGKTVALKTIGLLAAMAQSGMHIPAQRGSALPVFRNVLLDVGDEQSLQQSLSTFGGHIKRINHILRKADRHSLVLLDELGSGTDPDEGGAIGQAVLDELRRIGCLAMVTTHLGILKAYAINNERVDNASVEFDTKTLRPTYELRIGEPGESHAITVSAAMGMPKEIVSAARKYLNERTAAFRRAIRATSASRRASEEARSEAHTARMAAEAEQEAYQSKLADVKRLQGQFEGWLASLTKLEAGDQVVVPRMGRSGTLVRIQFNKQIAVVDVENVQVEVPLVELMPDLGQGPAAREMADLREQTAAQARQTDAARAEALRLQQEHQRSLAHQEARQKQFDQWLQAIGTAQVGQEVPIARPPGKGMLLQLDFLTARAKVETKQGVMNLPMQDLFPQVGPFARRTEHRPEGAAPRKPGAAGARPPRRPAERKPRADQPIPRRSPDSRAAKANRQAVLDTPPGEQVYVVPFQKRATLVRLDADRDQAVVCSGAFEMQVPIADLEPVRDR